MPIPEFDGFGLLPQGVHDCSLNEARNALCMNQRRVEIWERFQQFIEWVARMPGPVRIFVDGSFVTTKETPSDVDVVIDIS